MPGPSARMVAFLQFLPPDAFAFHGEVTAADRCMYTIATPGTPPATTSDYGRVFARAGWRDQNWDKITVTFYLPPKGGVGAEMFSIGVLAAAWGRAPGMTWKTMILASAPLGVLDFPV